MGISASSRAPPPTGAREAAPWRRADPRDRWTSGGCRASPPGRLAPSSASARAPARRGRTTASAQGARLETKGARHHCHATTDPALTATRDKPASRAASRRSPQGTTGRAVLLVDDRSALGAGAAPPQEQLCAGPDHVPTRRPLIVRSGSELGVRDSALVSRQRPSTGWPGPATTRVPFPHASERLDIANSETAPNRPLRPIAARHACSRAARYVALGGANYDERRGQTEPETEALQMREAR
jgi:hypothetical protein